MVKQISPAKPNINEYGSSLIPTDGEVIRTRRKLRDDGIICVSVTMGKDGELLCPVQLIGAGILDPKEDAELIGEYIGEITDALENMKKNAKDDVIKEMVRLLIRRAIKRDIDKKPVIEILLTRI